MIFLSRVFRPPDSYRAVLARNATRLLTPRPPPFSESQLQLRCLTLQTPSFISSIVLMAKTLTQSYVASVFGHLTSGNAAEFFDKVVDDVDWLVTGESHPLAGHWYSKKTFFQDSWSRVGEILQEPMQLRIRGVVVEPDGPGMGGKAVVELRGLGGVLKNGKSYNNEYCWVTRFNADGKIISVRAYLDTAMLRDALEGN